MVASKPQVSKHGDTGRLAAIYERAHRTVGWSLRRRLASTGGAIIVILSDAQQMVRER
jgi:hypothetical protein